MSSHGKHSAIQQTKVIRLGKIRTEPEANHAFAIWLRIENIPIGMATQCLQGAAKKPVAARSTTKPYPRRFGPDIETGEKTKNQPSFIIDAANMIAASAAIEMLIGLKSVTNQLRIGFFHGNETAKITKPKSPNTCEKSATAESVNHC